MSQPAPLNLKPRILYQVAKAAWEGKLFERRQEICQMVFDEFHDKATRLHVANQIRIAMGLNPHETDDQLNELDEEALMGIGSEPFIVADSSGCSQCPGKGRACEEACPLNAIRRDADGNIRIDYEKCVGDGACVEACSFGALAEKSQFVPLIHLLRQRTSPVYASVAPAFAGQFGPDVTPGKLRSALLKIGFQEMVETALYADLITMKEAFEFDERVKEPADFLLTSCCCPVWIKMIENKFPELIEHISPSVSPMVASARVIKALHPEAKVVFIGPCIAKKSEAQLPDLAGAVDFVLTFQELTAIFEATGIRPEDQEDEENAQASEGGRLYARTGGVSTAVQTTLQRLIPMRSVKFSSISVDGIPACQQILEKINAGQLDGANFIEGMACKGGCVGGPGKILPPEEGTQHVNRYGAAAASMTPAENPEVYSILNRLGSSESSSELTGESPMSQLLARKLKAK